MLSFLDVSSFLPLCISGFRDTCPRHATDERKGGGWRNPFVRSSRNTYFRFREARFQRRFRQPVTGNDTRISISTSSRSIIEGHLYFRIPSTKIL
ncbi:hypothetical protein CEXT_481781 [Caerostris extrusa]|uniref:Secreted protein n=1 Tax=Caerostris extrusa TaxID=172846 RepID=A0AAV4X4U7_CAEEX|nr:hypothetical protein CEXT_481781 [Caerostris extrusa]